MWEPKQNSVGANIFFSRVILMLFPVESAEKSPVITLVKNQSLTAGTRKYLLQKVPPESRGCAPSYTYRPNLVPEVSACFQPK